MKKIKGVLAWLLCVILLCASINVTANTDNARNNNMGVDVARKYAEEALWKFVDILMEDESFISRVSEKSTYSLAEPYIVYHVDESIQDCVYYFPIVDESVNKVVYLLEAIYADGTYTVNALDHMVDELNMIDYANNECIVYLLNGCIYIENEYEIVCANENMKVENCELVSLMADDMFTSTAFSEKKQLVSERMNELVEFDTTDIEYDNTIDKTKNYGSLSLYNPQYQHGYGMCWACAVATVQNYINQRVVTGFEVCTRMSIEYDEGGDVYDEQEALAKYNVNYDVITKSGLTWSKIVTNINAGYPIIANGINTYGGGHAVTIYGYTGSSYSSGTVYIWNSALTNGYAQLSNSQFTDGGGTAYDWATALSYY